MIFLNFKAYAKSTGRNGLALARIAEKFSGEAKRKTIACPSYLELSSCAKLSSKYFSVFAQHADAVEPGAFTSRVTMEALKEAGAEGTLVNHSERQVSFEHARFIVQKSNALKMKALVCADSVEKAVLFAQLRPWGIAVEPPELIGTGKSVSRARPEAVENAVSQIKSVSKEIKVIVGAGVADAVDYWKCMELGAEGVLISSRFVMAPDTKAWLAPFAKK
ncbi:MAG TPA: triose-phosphate isomerase [Candidatus Norongarragalinales archaeon]|nr:triose-phosphate isomerase [Candidatus Norongarragalinales archaeon]